MDRPLQRIGVHLVTAPAPGGRGELLEIVAEAIEGGVRLVQHRDKSADASSVTDDVRELVALCRPRGVLVVVNDSLDIALACDADGVHLGAGDLAWEDARRAAPRPFILGCTAATPERLDRAIAAGADYAGAGPAYATTTKDDAGPLLGVSELEALAAAARRPDGSRLPLVAIGGIRPGRAAALVSAGVTAVAVSAAVMRADDPRSAVRTLIREVETARQEATA